MRAPRRRKQKARPQMRPTLDEILAKNPHLNRDAVTRLLRESQGFVIVKREYGLASPYARRRVSVATNTPERTIVLPRRSLG